MMKANEKMEKRMLISKFDPVVIETLREIIISDMKKQLEEMKFSDDGCSEKCKIMKSISDKDLDRHRIVVNKFFEFQWCEVCTN